MMPEVFAGTDDYLVRTEIDAGFFVLHCEVYNWSAEIYKELLDILVDVMDKASDEGYPSIYVVVDNDDDKLFKFATMFGFELAGSIGEYYIMAQEVM